MTTAAPRPTMPRRARAALLVILLALPACAGLPAEVGVAAAAPGASAPKAGLVPRHAADIPGPACVAEHRAVIEEARSIAASRAAEAAALVRREPWHPHITRWFGDAPRPAIAARLERTADWLSRPNRAKTLCNDPPACRGPRMAYAAPARQIIGLCPSFFRARMDGFDNRWGVLIHEASHMAAGTQDHAYGPTAALILAKTDPARAAENADNYEYFAETLPR